MAEENQVELDLGTEEEVEVEALLKKKKRLRFLKRIQTINLKKLKMRHKKELTV